MEIKARLKKALRLTSDYLDDEVEDLIAACKKDLERVGIKNYNLDTDPLIFQAIKLYAKSHLDFNNDGERYEKSYELLVQSISLSSDYNEE